jgi:glycosyltransferase involved in cell wall biosynthesis
VRLIFVNRYFWPDASATSQLLTDLAVNLAAQGHAVTVLTSRQRFDRPAASLAAAEWHQGVEVRRVWTSRFGRDRLWGRALDYLTFYLSAVIYVLARVRAGDVVIAKTDPPLLGAVLGPFVRAKRARLVNWFQDIYPEVAARLGVVSEHSLLARLLRRWRNRSVRKAALNIVLGEGMREYVMRAVSSPGPMRVIHNWSMPLEYSSIPVADNPYRRQLGAQDKVLFSYSGNLGRAHRFEALLEAADRLRQQPHIRFLVTGAGPKLQAVRDEVQRRALPNWSFLPYQPRDQLALSLGTADVHLISLDPALEGLIVPSKIYGVMAAGRPCLFIGDPAGEVANLLRQYDCGTSMHPDDPAQLARTIERLAADPALRHRWGANARKAFEQHFSFAHAMRHWEEALGKLQQEFFNVS